MKASFLPVVFLSSFLAGEALGDGGMKIFRAGAAAVDITPRSFPVFVSGGFLAKKATTVRDRLHSRALILDDGNCRLAIVVVDSLMMERGLLDPVKEAVSRDTGIPADHVLISATHTHSAPSVMGALGTPVDKTYAKFLPGRIVESVVQANRQLEPARIGWAVIQDQEHNHCRRWIFRPDRMGRDPFGLVSVRAMMHPGHQSKDHVGPAGPADKDLSVLSVQSSDGRPIAVLANYAMHYKGTPPISADVCGRFGGAFAELIGAGEVDPPFVGILSQGTSGDSMWMDYSRPRNDPGLDGYARELAEAARQAYRKIIYQDWVPLDMAEAKLKLRRRTPDPERLARARAMAKELSGELPRNRPDVYALEAMFLHERPEVEIKLQAIRIGALGIAAFPNEVYGITGLKLKAQSPLLPTFNIELANGAQGYIPPPEQHALGGYTTWPARTAGLEMEAEPKIVETLLALLEKVSGQKRALRRVPPDKYVRAVMASRPVGFWHMDEWAGTIARDSSGNGNDGEYRGGVAFYLPGRSPRDLKDAEMASSRAAHFAGGRMTVSVEGVTEHYSVEMWLWNGLPSDAREVTGYLFAIGNADGVGADELFIGGMDAPGLLSFSSGSNKPLTGRTSLGLRTWNHVAVVRRGKRVQVYLNGAPEPEITGEPGPSLPEKRVLVIGGRHDGESGLEGKIDDVAYFNRALSGAEVNAHYRASGLGR